MGTPFIGEIRMFAGNFAPAGWAFCDGQLLAISQDDALFALIGTTYGGDGQTTFALPDLRGRVPMHQGNAHVVGEMGGTETVTLTANQIPAHTHLPSAAAAGNSPAPGGKVWAKSAAIQFAPAASANTTMSAQTIAAEGLGQPHDNMMPFQAISFIISLFGIFPSRN